MLKYLPKKVFRFCKTSFVAAGFSWTGKAQIASADLLAASVLLTLVFGITVHSWELVEKSEKMLVSTQNNAADALAQTVVERCGYAANTSTAECALLATYKSSPPYPNACVGIIGCGSGVRSNCTLLQCPRDVHAANRIMMCDGAASVLEVRACA